MLSRPFTILYIEDDIAIRQLVRLILERRENLLMLEAETGSQGLSLAEEHRPDMILLDLSLPDFSGFDVLKQIRESSTTRTIPVIAVSGSSAPADITRGLSAGFANYLKKPIDVESLNKAIDEAIAAHF